MSSLPRKPLVALLLVTFLLTLPLDWPPLPLNIRLPELVFSALVVLVGPTLLRRPRIVALDVLIAAYVLGDLPSFAATSSISASGVELLRHVYLVAVYVVIAAAAGDMRYRRAVGTGMALSGAAVAVLGVAFAAVFAVTRLPARVIGEIMPLPYVGSTLRLRALTATPAMLACVLTMSAPFAIVFALSERDAARRRRWIAAFIVQTVAIILTFSHVLAGFVTAALIASWQPLSRRLWIRRTAVAAAAAVFVVANLSVMVSLRQLNIAGHVVADRSVYMYAVDEGRFEAPWLQADYVVMSYLRIKQLAWNAFRAHPWTGVGLDRFHDVSERAYQEGRLTAAYRRIDPHSSLLGRLAESGVAGGVTLVLLWAGLLVYGARALHQRCDSGDALAAFAGLVGLLVAGINVDVMNFRFFWAALAILRAQCQPRPASAPASAAPDC